MLATLYNNLKNKENMNNYKEIYYKEIYYKKIYKKKIYKKSDKVFKVKGLLQNKNKKDRRKNNKNSQKNKNKKICGKILYLKIKIKVMDLLKVYKILYMHIIKVILQK